MCRETRTSDQLKGAVNAGARLARLIEDDSMSTPQQRELAEELHENLNRELGVLRRRGDL